LRIKTLEIAGFKSFVDKVVLAFQPGVSGIVGPNGCGKSNVVDAMRWAMGEQSPRRLRGKGMEDVIFAGSEVRAPVGMAEVVLSFDNADGAAPAAYSAYTEIQIARRLYRSGESEYLINKVPCRLRDVQDFFRDTGIGTKGYTIVEQGQIAGIVSAKPEDRRSLIEEAAGIGKYKVRRQEAERKMEGTEHNLVRVNDVLGEIRRQIGTLERQAKKAARYKRLKEMQRLLELSLASDERRELGELLAAARQGLAALREQATSSETRLAGRELALEEARLELAECERVLNQDSEVLVGLRGEIKELESRIGYETRERVALAEMNVARREEQGGLSQQRSAALAELDAAEAALAAVEAALGAEAEAIAAAEEQARLASEGLHGLERERDAASTALVDTLTSGARLEDRQASLEDRRAELDRRLRSADELLEVQTSEAAGVAREERELAEGLRNLLAERDRLMGELRAALERVERTHAEVRASSERARAARESRDLRRARLESLREVVERREDLGEAARHLLEQAEGVRERLGLRALVRDVLEADPEVEAAVEAVLAERAEALVVGEASHALAAIAELRAASAGRGVFLALPAADVEPLGFVPLGQPLLERVRARAGFEGVARALLAGVNLVDDLGEALRIYGGGRLPASFVTPAGDLLAPDGIVRGGGEAASSGLLARARELRELEIAVSALEADLVLREGARAAAESAASAASDELDNLRNRHHTVALAVANHEKDFERARDRAKSLGEAREGRVAERSELLAESEALAAELTRLGEALLALRQDRSERQRALDAVGLRVGSASREVARFEAALSGRRVEHAGRVEKREALCTERSRAAGALRTAEEWIARREAEISGAEARREELARTIAEAETLLARRLDDEESARATHEEKRDHYEREAARVREIEGEARSLRTESTEVREAVQRAELGLRESEFRLESLEQQVQERWGVELASWLPPAPGAVDEIRAAADEGEGETESVVDGGEHAADEDDAPALTARASEDLLALPRDERERRVSDVRRKLEALGEVNLGAIEEHEELSERYRFLSEQKADLESTLGSLREAILRINRTSRKRFQETFEAVNARFVENFPRLFRGGRAHLALTEEEDVLDAGIEIVASPPGKRLQSVNLLSGGEKTLTALALLVSVFQVRPSPFFLLDEVDAALDDANVGRFNEIVRELARDSQFLLITHNKRTIEVADVLYGVTMEERGVSKLVTVELRDTPAGDAVPA
jgi:chromosome segregation protein